MGMFPQAIQQNGLVGSLVNGIGGALKGLLGAPTPQLPVQAGSSMQQPRPPPFQPPPNVGMASANDGPGGFLGQLFGGGTPA
jgi:hypothetical protein